MEYRIVEKKGFRVVGFGTKEPMTMEDCFEKVPRFWAARRGDIPQLCELMDGTEPKGVLGVSACDGGQFSGYYIAVATERPAPAGMDEYAVPAGTWAVFAYCGPMPEAMQTLQKRIVSEWLPNSGYEYAAAPDIEVYGVDNYHHEVWLPVIKADCRMEK